MWDKKKASGHVPSGHQGRWARAYIRGVMRNVNELLLVPRPRRVEALGGVVTLPMGAAGELRSLRGQSLANIAAVMPSWIRVRMEGAACGTSGARLQGYTLSIQEGGVEVECATPAGLGHALATLEQLVAQGERVGDGLRLAAVRIMDWPTFATRGVMLDVSRDRVPTMTQLYETVDLLASLKLNHLQLYTEHTFAYEGHEEVWSGWSPMTAAEVVRLDEYCRARSVELAANQNCFGHLASWLRKPKYAALAETHGDWVFDCWPRSGPFSLCPTDPKSIGLVEDMLGQLLPCFTSGLVNIGCDETYDIAYGRSKAEVERRGRVAVYLDFVAQICGVARGLGKRPMFWADIALSKPEAVKDIPEDLLALAWSYEADAPFDRWCEVFAKAGREAWVCPGTSSWRSITGRTTERKGNVESAARAGAAHGATGFLVCDWGDTGHHQQWAITQNALAHAAAAAWNLECGYDAAATSLHVFGDRSLRVGGWLDEVGDADLALRETCLELSTGQPGRLRNQSAMFIDMLKPLDELTHVGAVGDWWGAVERVARARETMPRGLGVVLEDELVHTLNVAQFAALRGWERRREGGISEQRKKDQRAMVEATTREHRRLWCMRSRQGGLDHSCTYYEGVAASFGG